MTNEAFPTTKDETNKPELTITVPTVSQEVDFLWYILKSASRYDRVGLKYEIPDHNIFRELAADPTKIPQTDKKAVTKFYEDRFYDPNFYLPGLAVLENQRDLVEEAFPVLQELADAWGFKVFSNYELVLTKWGPGGNCSADNNTDTEKNILRTDRNGEFVRSNPAHIAIREMVNMGMRDAIYERFGLTWEERERLSDLVTGLAFSNLMPDFNSSDRWDKKIDNYVTKDSLVDLPAAIQRYVGDNPRP